MSVIQSVLPHSLEARGKHLPVSFTWFVTEWRSDLNAFTLRSYTFQKLFVLPFLGVWRKHVSVISAWSVVELHSDLKVLYSNLTIQLYLQLVS